MQLGSRIGSKASAAPGDVGVGADQDAAVLADLASAGPVSVEVDVLASRSDDVGGDLDAQSVCDGGRGIGPCFAGDTGEQAEPAFAGQVVGGDLVPVAAEPDVR